LSFLQLLVYRILKVLIRLFARLYYPRTLVLGREHFHLKDANIVVANHPNTLIDPLSAAFRLDKPLFYLANAGLYKYAFMRKLLDFLYAIRVERPQDVNGGRVNNEQAFKEAIAKLSAGYSIFIAPEGTSEMDRRLRPLRTGAARIALQAEADNGFSLGLRILPIGLTYDKPEESGSGLVVYAGAPILVKHWQQQYLQDPYKAVLSLTQEISDRLAQLMLNPRSLEEDLLHRRLEEILEVKVPCTPREHWDRGRDLLEGLRTFGAQDPEAMGALKGKVATYLEKKEQYGLRESTFSKNWAKSWMLLVIFPVWAFAWLHHYVIPALLLQVLGRKVKLYIGYATTLKWLGAFLILPFWYGMLIALVPGLLEVNRSFYALALICSGPIFVRLRPAWRDFSAMVKGRIVQWVYPQAWADIQALRIHLASVASSWCGQKKQLH
jgi:glycerol-3-phosphate O-acyltransferase/dihydroxyacetone phosphate acyltransferase